MIRLTARSLCVATGILLAMGAKTQAEPIGTAFTYQGQLKQGGIPLNDTATFEFSLWDDPTNVDPGSQVGATLIFDGQGDNPPPIDVVNGLFTVQLDFGTGVFTGNARWLEITVTYPTGGSPVTLSPRQPITPAPYALALPALWTEQNATSPNIIAGHGDNIITEGAHGVTLSGGGSDGVNRNTVTDHFGTIGGGTRNRAGNNVGATDDATAATVGGGSSNQANAQYATVAGGHTNYAEGAGSSIAGGSDNLAFGSRAAVGGGEENVVTGAHAAIAGGNANNAGGRYAAVGGGVDNSAGGEAGAVPGGRGNQASGDTSFAAGYRARAEHEATFVWSDSADEFFTSTGPDQFLIKAAGGVGINTNAPGAALHIGGTAGVDGLMFPDGTLQTSAATGGGNSWALTGNAGTTPGANFVGTTDDQPLELHVNDVRALRIEPNNSGPNLVGGYYGNTVTADVAGATISGGGTHGMTNRVTDRAGAIGGGVDNQAGDDAGHTSDAAYSTVAGGCSNTAAGLRSTVSGGCDNTASGINSTVGGGASNNASDSNSTVSGGATNEASGSISTVAGGTANTASGDRSTVGGGDHNTATGYVATIPGGSHNEALNAYSFAAGQRARANHWGSFVWSDSTTADPDFFYSTGENQFLIKATGGVGINTNAPGAVLHIVGGTPSADGMGNALRAESTEPGAVAVYATAIGAETVAMRASASGDTQVAIEANATGTATLDEDPLPNTAGKFFASGLGSVGVFGHVDEGQYGVHGRSDHTYGAGVFGEATTSGDGGIGVYGEAASTVGRGVVGFAPALTGSTYGVYGYAVSPDGAGVYGRGTATTGNAFGVRGQTNSPVGYAAYFTGGRNYFEGRVGIGQESPQTRLHIGGVAGVDGLMFPDGTLQTAAAVGDGHSLDAADGDPVDALFLDNNGAVTVLSDLRAGDELKAEGEVTLNDPSSGTDLASLNRNRDGHGRLVTFADGSSVSSAVVGTDTDANGAGGLVLLSFDNALGPAVKLESTGNAGRATLARSTDASAFDETVVVYADAPRTDLPTVFTHGGGIDLLNANGVRTIALRGDDGLAGDNGTIQGFDGTGALVFELDAGISSFEGNVKVAGWIGTDETQPVTLKTDNQTVLTLAPASDAWHGFAPNLVGGHPANYTASGVIGAFIGGGGYEDPSPPNNPRPNRVIANFGAVAGGYNNEAGYFSFVGGGAGNSSGNDGLDAQWATVGGGQSNSAMNYGATVGGGVGNEANGDESTVAGGSGNVAGDHEDPPIGGYGEGATVGGGRYNIARQTGTTIPGGMGALARIPYQMAYAAKSFDHSNPGDAQTSVYVLRELRFNDMTTVMSSGSYPLTVPDGTTWVFEMFIAARAEDGTSAGYQVTGAIRGSGATTSFVGNPVVTVLGEDPAASPWSVGVEIGENFGVHQLDIRVSGADDVKTRWVATVRTTEVSWPSQTLTEIPPHGTGSS